MVKQLPSLVTRARSLAIQQVLDEAAEKGDINASNERDLRNAMQLQLEGFGFLQQYLDDETVEEVWVNRPSEVWFARNGVNQSQSVSFTSQDLHTLVERMIRTTGRRLDRSSPFIDAQLPNGYRLHAVIPDITREFLSLNIRKFSNRVLTLSDLVDRGVLSESAAQFLVNELKHGSNLIISGATQAGKTTLLSALLSSLDVSERVVSVEDTFELRCLLPDWVALQTRPASIEGRNEIDLRRLVRETLRMRPSRLVVGEVRSGEALDMLIAMNSGIPGLCTVHANSTAEALQKLRTLPLLAGANISSQFIDSVIASSMRLFVHCTRNNRGQRTVSAIAKLSEASLTLTEVHP